MKCLSNVEIAGSLRNSFRASLDLIGIGGRALFRLGGEISLPNLDKLRIPMFLIRSQTVTAKCHCQKGNSPDRRLRSLIKSKWQRMSDCLDNQEVCLEAAIL